MTEMDVLHRLVDDLDVLRTAWEREPFVSTGLGDLDDVFSVEEVERLVHSGLPVESVRLFRRGEQVPREQYTRGRERGVRDRYHLVDPDRVRRLVAAGATLVLDDLQSHSDPVAAFAARVAEATGYETDCAAFLTPGGTRGAAPHFDMVSGFLRQVWGSKRWRVGAPARRWPNRRTEADPAAVEVEPVLDVVLHAGDCLYIPRGFVHVGDTTDEPSAHLSVSVRSATWEAVFRAMLAAAAEGSEELREALPPVFAKADRAELFRERSAALAEYLAGVRWSDIRVESFRTSRAYAPPTPGALRSALLDGSA
jgi:lysine-specific demethylase/histidyl-hydroxylase NO66